MTRRTNKNIVRAVLLALPLISGAGLAHADDAGDSAGVSIELSAAEVRGQGCLLSFVAENGSAQDITKVVYETVLFGAKGEVALLTLLDFQDLPAGRPRVRQFQFDTVACDQISRILINGAETCDLDGGPADVCIRGLKLKSRLETEMIG
ncbi:hypothetical protein [Ruegeria sp.]|uniref:hypothetical protein n=1 Tax=Ruegeria sp. TaxID=1879320 RepID=UPI00232583E0|nr:hypothetical protein [Ruegeria sp.]MDA7965254.1 hypothetical protein [Ruegeria sp.]